jgi:hypothetical protein
VQSDRLLKEFPGRRLLSYTLNIAVQLLHPLILNPDHAIEDEPRGGEPVRPRD